ncbi:MAG: tRNA pseudouridine(65) synthase TruC [Chitinophagales bacterium]|nr:tRNA pseudouridine(65) synthase TruC [Chitinophagales bacterium]
MLEIIYEDEWFIGVNKPEAMLVHRTRISEDNRFVMQDLRDQIGQHVFTIHRLDRATSGVLLFGKSAEAAGALAEQFRDKALDKHYLSIVRGWAPDSGTVDYAVRDQDKPDAEFLPAVSHYRTLGRSEVPHAIGYKYQTARFSLVEVMPETGRRHQIRKHFAHILHPVIGDKRHGDNKHNRYFWGELQLCRMFLHAWQLQFEHPFTQAPVCLTARVDELFQRTLKLLELEAFLPESAAFLLANSE